MPPALRTASRAATRHGRAAALFALLLVVPGAAQLPPAALQPAEVDTLSRYLEACLAAPTEAGYGQVLAEARIELDPTDSVAVYDVIVRFDPDRYHTPYAGLYPLSFEDQFIQWGKRIALFTRSVPVRTGRYFLHDLSTGEHAWMFTEETRLLYPTQTVAGWPGMVAADAATGQAAWLRRIHGADPGTPLEQMTKWLRLLRRESRESLRARLSAAGG